MAFTKTHIALLSFLLLACDNKPKEIDPPANVLKIEAFAKVLADFSLAESAANLNIKGVAQNKTDSVYAFNPLIENGVRQSQFDSSMDFYCHHSALYKQVYEMVLAKLTEFETKKNALPDSIKSK